MIHFGVVTALHKHHKGVNYFPITEKPIVGYSLFIWYALCFIYMVDYKN